MKTLQYILVITIAILCAALSSCQTPAQTDRLSALGSIIVTYSENHNIITADEAALIREAGLIVPTPTPADTTSAKQPVETVLVGPEP